MTTEQETWNWFWRKVGEFAKLAGILSDGIMNFIAKRSEELRRDLVEKERLDTIVETLKGLMGEARDSVNYELDQMGLNPILKTDINKSLAELEKYEDVSDCCVRTSCLNALCKELKERKLQPSQVQKRVNEYISFAKETRIQRMPTKTLQELKLDAKLRKTRTLEKGHIHTHTHDREH